MEKPGIKMELGSFKDLSDLGKFVQEGKIKLILFGETHGMINELPIQEEVIKSISPELYLYELLEEEKILNDKDAERFLKTLGEEDFSVISTFEDLKPTIRLARKFNLPLVGCDIKNMLRKDKNFLEEINDSKESIEKENHIMEKREMQQKKIIEEYLPKTENPLFVSLGLYHIRKESFLIKNLNCDFLIAFPVVDGNKKLWETEDFNPKDISYIITSKEKYLEN